MSPSHLTWFSSHTLAYLTLAFFFAVIPGATTAVVIRHTLAGGRRAGMTASIGAISASAVLASLALGGVSALLVRWPAGLKLLGIAGALFLAWTAVKSLRAALRAPSVGAQPTSQGRSRFTSAYREGFTVNILNPSVLSFYVGVTPTFLDPGATWRQLVLLYVAHLFVVLGCHTFWTLVFNQARGLFAGERPRRWLDAAVGVLLLWLAVRIFARL